MMQSERCTKAMIAAAVATLLGAPVMAQVNQQGKALASGVDGGTLTTWDRDLLDAYKAEQTAIENALLEAGSRGDYQKILEAEGYRITAVNESSPSALEYEIVKDNHSFEVKLGFNESASKATSVDVDDNVWEAQTTVRARRDAQYQPTGGMMPPGENAVSASSDRSRLGKYESEKTRLETTLLPGKPVSQYPELLKQEGYQITAVNESEPDYAELEVVKGKDTYEVKLDRDPDTAMVTKVDVTSNLWQADATEKALQRK